MSIFDSIILGFVEGISEFLPISSTGHLILATHLLGISSSEFIKSFEIIIQLGAILAVVYLYWRVFLDIEALKKVAVGFIPTGVIGFALYGFIKAHLLGSTTIVLWSLLLGGIALIAFEYWHEEDVEGARSIHDISYTQALLVGVFQSVAIIPGISRSAATIVGGMLLGMRRATIVEFSFILAVPTMLAATGLDLVKNASSFSLSDIGILSVGFVVSFIVALFSVKFLLLYIRNHNFVPFGLYRIALAILFFLFVMW